MIQQLMDLAQGLGNQAGGGSVQVSPDQLSVLSGYTRYELFPFKDNELSFVHWEGFLANFGNIHDEIRFIIHGNVSAIRLYLEVPTQYAKFLENVFYANYSTSDLLIAKQQGPFGNNHTKFLKFSKACVFYDTSTFSRGGAYIDPFKDVLAMFASVPGEETLTITFHTQFYEKISFRKKILLGLQGYMNRTTAIKDEKPSTETKDAQQANEVKQAGRDIKFYISFTYIGQKFDKDILNVFDKFLKEGDIKIVGKKHPVYTNMNQFINFFHVPTKEHENKALQYTDYRKLAYPMNIPTVESLEDENITALGTTDFRTSKLKFGVKKEDKFRHFYIVGKTGMGKSTFISNMVRSDMHTGNGIAILDPHGDLVEDVLAHVPSWRTNDVIMFDVADVNYPVGFNILECTSPDQKNLVASGVVSTFKKLYGDSWGPRLEYILRNIMLSILEYPNPTLMHVVRMLTDKNFREDVLTYVSDPIIMKFWRDEYDKWPDKQVQEAVGPITNKVGQFLSSTVVRNIFAQPQSKINIRKCMDEGKILLINLSKGRIGDDNASMIGSFLVTKFYIDAMSRADIPARERRDFYLYVDEFQNFATDSFENILSEARKYRLSLIMANQYTTQIQENVRNAIFGNVGTIVSFALGYDDAVMMSSQFKGMITPNDILSIPKFKAYIKLMVDGMVTDPFSMSTFPLPSSSLDDEIKAKIRSQSRQRYAMEKEKLEQLLKVRAEKQFTQAEKVKDQAKAESLQADGSNFSIKDIILGQEYEGYVKLLYNYGIFVTVKGVEGLLHKSNVNMPKSMDDRKNIYNIGDRIKVKALEFKEVNGEKKMIWSQK